MLFPWVGMFEQVALADVFVHYDDVQFSKGSFTNRVQVKTASGIHWLTVPLRKFRLGETIANVRANDDLAWRDDHVRLLDDAYRGAPHVTDMLEVVRSAYGVPDPLPVLLTAALERVASLVGAADGTQFVRSSELGVDGRGWERVLEIVRHFDGSVYVTGHGARNYLDSQAFEDAGVEVRFMDYACRPYPQLHGPFTPYVSVLDLLANTGPEAGTFLDPRTVDWRTFAARAEADP